MHEAGDAQNNDRQGEYALLPDYKSSTMTSTRRKLLHYKWSISKTKRLLNSEIVRSI